MSLDERRATIIQAAFRVISEQGVAAATTRAIVAEAGMPLASFHYAFASRDEMMRALIEWDVEHESQAAFATIQMGRDIRTSVRACLQAFFDTVLANPEHEQVLAELHQYALRTPGLEDFARDQFTRYYQAVSGLMEAGAAAAGVVWTSPIWVITRFIICITGGVSLAWRADRDDLAAGRVLDLTADAIAAMSAPAEKQADETSPTPTGRQEQLIKGNAR